jgi:hypothetical protein
MRSYESCDSRELQSSLLMKTAVFHLAPLTRDTGQQRTDLETAHRLFQMPLMAQIFRAGKPYVLSE